MLPLALHLWEPDSCTHTHLLLNFHVAYSSPWPSSQPPFPKPAFPGPFPLYTCLTLSHLPTPSFSHACLSRSIFSVLLIPSSPCPSFPTARQHSVSSFLHFPSSFLPCLCSFSMFVSICSIVQRGRWLPNLPFSHVFAPFLCLAAYAALSREKMAPDEEVRSPGCSLIRDGGFPLIPAIPTSPQLRLSYRLLEIPHVPDPAQRLTPPDSLGSHCSLC